MKALKVTDSSSHVYRDTGQGQPIVVHRDRPLSADDWDAQMMFFLRHSDRVIARDRWGHGRSTQTTTIDVSDDLKAIDVPTWVMDGEDDQTVAFADAGPLLAKLRRTQDTKFCPSFPHGVTTTNAGQINADLLAFVNA